ncbi:AAEL009382-PA [Aedes aegypti]|uniref:Bifunctional lysine-specific demethylase and histidyl-hydroxylase NO66 n=1 Tax=Aedes aegypti TaxID=7159 RepID=NO66_AEDAE|nr:RecName: Full=Bifunctional lysine-specific demethylase and histidyl-hydroxylase NO66; AltName: Full=Histone lysine demethylase NO66 [Aedes aegypti]EAT38759.1 AAEL009382-PA [Aedes aegypti]
MSAVSSIFDTPIPSAAKSSPSGSNKRPLAQNGHHSGEKQSKKSKKASKKQLIDLLVQEHARELSQNDSSASTVSTPKKKKKKNASASDINTSASKNVNAAKKKPKEGLKINLQNSKKKRKNFEVLNSSQQHADDALVETSFNGESLKNNSNHSTPVSKKPKKKNKQMPHPLAGTPNLAIKQEPQTPKANGMQRTSAQDSIVVGREKFAWVIHPTPVEDFMINYWEKKPLLIQRKNPSYYSNLLSRAKIDEMLRQNNIEYTKNIDVTSYREGQRETHNPDGRVLPPDMWSFYEEGCSIRMLNPQTYLPGVYEMNVKLQEFFHCMTGANFYLTPPNSQGFAPHYDDIEAFVLQVEGRKHWKLYSPREPAEMLARVSSPNFTQEEIGTPILEVVLEPGDLLYFPRGIIHQASTVPGHHSLHVTMSVYQKNCWADLLELFFPHALAQAAETHFDLRRGIPLNLHQHFGIVHSDSETPARKQLISHIKSLVDKVFSEDAIDSAVDQLAKRFQHDALPPLISNTEQSTTVYGSSFSHNPDGTVSLRVPFTENSTVRLLRCNVLRLVSEEEKLRIYYHTDNSREYHEYEPNFLEIDQDAALGVELLVKMYPHPVAIRDLPVEDKIEFAKSLWEKGLIVVHGQ